MTIDPDSFRSVLGRFASGVTVVTAVDGGTAGTAAEAGDLARGGLAPRSLSWSRTSIVDQSEVAAWRGAGVRKRRVT